MGATARKDELITFAELIRRTGKSSPYYAKIKKNGKLYEALECKKVWYLKALKILKLDPNNPAKKSKRQLEQMKSIAKRKALKDETIENDFEDENKNKDQEVKELLDQILKAIKDPKTGYVVLDALESKVKIIKLYYSSQAAQLSYEKELGNLFDRESIERILSFSFNAIRNNLINLANNYAVNLEGLNKKEIKDYVENDINKLLETLQNTEQQFDKN